MGGTTHQDNEGIITDINVTPLVDIILVLLITFMLTASLIERQAIKLELPKAAAGDGAQATTLSLTIARDGSLYLNGKPTNEGALREYLQQTAATDPKIQAVIAADTQVPHGQVVHLMDLTRQAGIYRFAINIDPTPAPPVPP